MQVETSAQVDMTGKVDAGSYEQERQRYVLARDAQVDAEVEKLELAAGAAARPARPATTCPRAPCQATLAHGTPVASVTSIPNV